jgi:hypothetical protein
VKNQIHNTYYIKKLGQGFFFLLEFFYWEMRLAPRTLSMAKIGASLKILLSYLWIGREVSENDNLAYGIVGM